MGATLFAAMMLDHGGVLVKSKRLKSCRKARIPRIDPRFGVRSKFTHLPAMRLMIAGVRPTPITSGTL